MPEQGKRRRSNPSGADDTWDPDRRDRNARRSTARETTPVFDTEVTPFDA